MAEVRQVPFKITEPDRIPSKRYYDEDFYKAEVEHLWPHVWQMACRLELIPEVGDWIEYENLGKSVIVVRTKDGVKAYHNACRHRGVPLNDGQTHGNCKGKGFICPFHGWRWNMEGENTFVYGRHLFEERQLDQADLALKPCRVELAGGCAFINHDDNAPSLSESLGPVMKALDAHGMSNLRSEWWVGTVLPANWKVAMEAFMEGYHVMRTHPQLQRTAPALYNSMYGFDTGGIGVPINPDMSVRDNIMSQMDHLALLSEGMNGMVDKREVEIARPLVDAQFPDDPMQAVMMFFGMINDQVHKQLSAKGVPVPDLNAAAVNDPVNAVEFLFPHYFLLPMFSAMSSYRIRPLGPESCLFELWALAPFAPGEEPAVPQEMTMLPYDSQEFPPIPRQDYSNIPIQQKGMHATGFDFMRLSYDKEGLISNYQRIIDGYLAGADPLKLAQAQQTLKNNFDGKFVDYDF
ncbi:MAG: aromatic ring-hydroxylating oxygenase subunit alpha [Novosphingobium sp.]